MRSLFRTLGVAGLVLLPVASMAQNPRPSLTARDLVALTQAGLSDDVLVAMIEADRAVFSLTPLDVIDLRKQGLSDGVLVRMIRTAPVVPPAPERDVRVRPVPEERESPPVVVQQTVVQKVTQEVKVEAPRYVPVPVYVPLVPRVTPPVKKEPEYWGFGGQRRPDSWQDAQPDPKAPVKKPGGGV